jgi:DNA-directed RNA polymerase specialized sigma24 family protein
MPNKHAEPVASGEKPPMELMLQCLPVQHQEIIVATYFRGHTMREAANLLGLPPATAKARLFQAMSDLSLMLATRHPVRVGAHRR